MFISKSLFLVIHNHASLLCCFKKLSSSLAFYVLIINWNFVFTQELGSWFTGFDLSKHDFKHKKGCCFSYTLASLRKHPFLLALRSFLSDEERGETDVFASYTLALARPSLSQANLGFRAVRSLNYVIQRIRLKYKKHVNLAPGFSTELH